MTAKISRTSVLRLRILEAQWVGVAVVVYAVVGCSTNAPVTNVPQADASDGVQQNQPTTDGEAVPQAVCGIRACKADPAAGRAALERGDFAAARVAYQCGDTREAAFGAGLATLLTAIESPSATQVLSDLGLPPFPATDLFGRTGAITRNAARWPGHGQVRLRTADAGGIDLVFERGQQVQDASRYVRMRSTTTLAHLNLELGARTLVAGESIALGRATTDFAPYVYVRATDLTCSTTSSSSSNAGSITIGTLAGGIGQTTEYTFENVALACADRNTNTSSEYRLDGTLTTVLGEASLDLSDLHPLLSDNEPFDNISPSVTLGQLAADAKGLGEAAELAACYFKAAGKGATGRVFEIPGSVFGAGPVPVNGADSEVLGAACQSIGAGVRILRAYDLPMQLSGLLCGASVACLKDEDAVTRVNAGIGALVSPELVHGTRDLLIDAAGLTASALLKLGPEGLILRSAETAPALDRYAAYLAWARDALAGNNPPVPQVTPQLQIDLAGVFAAPPDPSKIANKPFFYERLDAGGGQVGAVEAYFRAAFPALQNLGWTSAFWDRFEVAPLEGPDRSELIARRLEGFGLAAGGM